MQGCGATGRGGVGVPSPARPTLPQGKRRLPSLWMRMPTTTSYGKQHEIKYCTSPQNIGERFGRHVTRTTLFLLQNYSTSPAMARLEMSGQFQQPVLEPSRDYLTRAFHDARMKRRVLSRVECFLSSDLINSGWLKPRRWENFTNLESACVQPEYKLPIRTRADCKAEQYEITGSPLSPSDVPAEAVRIGDTNEISPWWQEFPKRWTIVLLCFFAFLLCNMDRVNMSIAILPMSSEFSWNPATVGLIQSSFFWGYLLTQILGGIWADRFGGKVVLGFGVVWWSLATILTPLAAKVGLPCLLTMRAFMGIGEVVCYTCLYILYCETCAIYLRKIATVECNSFPFAFYIIVFLIPMVLQGVAMPAMNNILSKWIPVSERSRSLALVYSGMYLGSVTGLAFSPLLISKFGWPSVFYAFGSLGSVWFALWQSKAHSSPDDDPGISKAEKRHILGGGTFKEPVTSIPWRLILSKAPVWALIISHFCHNWGTFILLTWMPTYYNQVLKFNLTESGLLCVLPWLTMAVFANIGGWIADTLVQRGVSITNVRKIMQSIGFLGPALFLTLLSKVRTPAMAVLCMACSQGSDAFSQSGLYSNHQDIGPRYAGVLLGLSNTAGVLAGVFGTAATGYILQKGSWDSVFKVAVALYIVGTVVWNVFSTGEKVLE
ncbi:putative anion transporter 4, chloroplastic [Dichanthelium oligosanthes]|uniref:Putative anion transporter 4, chloroplastic n=1 Tax=Dichanthelium oligosanthes TaxID=888268 RepID=A0A1E5UZP0_9POAL|nr:putative anion transporter 4, chloroplastic [Dichanthelium oligosanthes]